MRRTFLHWTFCQVLLVSAALAVSGCPPEPASTGVALGEPNARAELETVQGKLDDLDSALRSRDDRIQALEKRLADRDQRLAERAAQFAEFAAALGALDVGLREALGALEAAGLATPQGEGLVASFEETSRRVAALEAARDALRTDLDHASGASAAGRDALREQVEAAVALQANDRGAGASARGAMEARLADIEKDVAWYRRIVKELQKRSPVTNLAGDVPAIRGRVLAVDGPFILLSAGVEVGVQELYEFNVQRGDHRVAKISVLEVQPGFSSARVVFRVEGESVQVGDLVTTEG